MPRYEERIVPPIPRDASPQDMAAYRFWRRGHSLREAASMAGISHLRLHFLLNQKHEPSEASA